MGHKKASILDEQDRDLLAHVHSLGLQTVEEYREWCAQNGFSRRLIKDWKQRCRERSLVHQAMIQDKLQRRKRERRNPVNQYADICAGRLDEDDLTQPHLKRLFQAIVARRAARKPQLDLDALRPLLLHLHSCRFDLSDLTPAISDLGFGAGNSYIEALVVISAHRRSWLRPFDTWKPRTHNARRQFASLLRYLFVQYDDMPLFFDSVWFAGLSAKASEQRRFYRHVGSGRSIRLCELPIPYTKRMAHHFMRAPSDVTFEKALRWGQVIGLGGDERLARALVATRLGDNFDNNDFWITVIQWYILHPTLDRVHVGPIIDYLHHQRFTPIQINGNETASAEPNLTMKGRMPDSLLRKVHDWHRTLAKGNTHQVGEWTTTGIEAFEFAEGSAANGTLKVWRIRELLSSKALMTEGRQMKHCVAIYATSCKRGSCSIWTMEVGQTKALTIEIRNHLRQICQARGKANRLPTEKELSVLRRWATQVGLTIGKTL